MNTATLDDPALAAITSTVGALSDRELLCQTSTLVRHERHLLGAVIDHLAEIEARRLYLQRGCSSLFDYAARELGYSDAAAARRIGAVRLCADQPDARERLRDGSLTLSAAAELQWAFDRQRRRGSICGTASRAPAGSARAGATAPDGPAADATQPATSVPAASPPLVLDAAGRQKLVEDAAGKSARQVRRMLADLDPELATPTDRVRPLGDGRYELKALIDADCQQGLEQLRGLLSHVDTVHDDRTARRPHRAGGAGSPRPEPAAAPGAHQQPAGGGRRHAGSGSEGAGRPGTRSRFDAAGRGVSRRHHSDSGVDGGADAATEPAGNDGSPGRCPAETDRRRSFDSEAARFGPCDPGGGATTGVAAGRRPLQLRRSADRTALQLTTSDRDRPHPAVCAWRRRRSWKLEIVM